MTNLCTPHNNDPGSLPRRRQRQGLAMLDTTINSWGVVRGVVSNRVDNNEVTDEDATINNWC